ncbi:MAG: NAD(P)/FAD-dependent oxidoreductase [Rhizomicrobium sp.]
MSAAAYDVAIAGAGIVGAACAYELAGRGMRVAAIEREVVGSGATAAAMGHVAVMDDSDAQFALTRFSQQLWRELRDELPPEVEYDACGTLWIASSEQDLVEAARKQAHYRARGVPAEIVDARALERMEPNLRKGLAGGLLVPEDTALYPQPAARFLMRRAQDRGAVLLHGLVREIGRGRAGLADGSELSAGCIVNAAGAWSPALTPGIDVKKRKGHLAITDPYPGFVHRQLVELGYLRSAHAGAGDSVAFNIQPRGMGQMLIGSSRQYDAESSEVESDILARMLARAREYLPNLAGISPVRAWAGFRPATSDKLPLIGPWPGDETIYLATGHEGLGITTALGTARLIADQLTGTACAIPIEPYLPSGRRKV